MEKLMSSYVSATIVPSTKKWLQHVLMVATLSTAASSSISAGDKKHPRPDAAVRRYPGNSRVGVYSVPLSVSALHNPDTLISESSLYQDMGSIIMDSLDPIHSRPSGFPYQVTRQGVIIGDGNGRIVRRSMSTQNLPRLDMVVPKYGPFAISITPYS